MILIFYKMRIFAFMLTNYNEKGLNRFKNSL
jgi:hypothetical protein